MSVAFKPGQALGPTDLKIEIRNNSGDLIDPYIITYSLFDVTTGVEVLIGAADQTPSSPAIGVFYVAQTIPLDANIGDWLVRWNFREIMGSPLIQAVQEFNVVGLEVLTSITDTPVESLMIRRLRILLRDNNPDRNYRFRPPARDQFLQTQTEVFGYIWEDEELFEYLLMAVDDFNSMAPITGIALTTMPMRWRTAILLRAGAFAMFAITLNWISEEFSYSVSGVSLDLEKSSKYQSMKENFIQEYDKLKEQAKASIKIVKGLKQPRYGIGISSALGPFSRPGAQSRRNWVSGSGGGWS